MATFSTSEFWAKQIITENMIILQDSKHFIRIKVKAYEFLWYRPEIEVPFANSQSYGDELKHEGQE